MKVQVGDQSYVFSFITEFYDPPFELESHVRNHEGELVDKTRFVTSRTRCAISKGEVFD